MTKVFAGGATIRGRVVFAGEPPRGKLFKLDADPQCAALHAGNPLVSESVIVNADGTLRNVFVYIADGITGTYEPPKTPVTIDQVGCRYSPPVLGMQTKQMLVIKNSDATLHNIHALGTDNQEFSKGQPAGSADLKTTFVNPEVMVRFRCDVHPWMTAYVGVLDHPFYCVTGVDGSYALGALPAGDYTVSAWHEVYGVVSQRIGVAALDVGEIDFQFQPR